MDSYRVGVSPHVRHEASTRSIMLDVVIALIPSMIWGFYIFGFRAMVITLVSVVSAVLFEALFQVLMHRRVSVSDGSAVVTGLLMAMNVSASVPLWILPLGTFFAIGIVKQLFGGLGKNFVNPVLAARAFLFVSFPGYMSSFPTPFSSLSPFAVKIGEAQLADAVTSATPLKTLKAGQPLTDTSIFDLLTGNYAGCIGEVSALLLLAGGIYLLVKRVISWRIPVSYLGTVALLTFLFPRAGGRLDFMLSELLAGGIILGAIFMATDYVTSPVTKTGRLIYGVGCGAITVFIRYFGGYSEGCSFAILIMNLLVWYLDLLCKPRPYGKPKKFGKKKKEAV